MKRPISLKITAITIAMLLLMSIIFALASVDIERTIYLESLSKVCSELSDQLYIYNYDHKVKTVADIKESLAGVNAILKNCCNSNNVKYAYILDINEQAGTKEYISLCDENGVATVTSKEGGERNAGTVVNSEMNEKQRDVLYGEEETAYYTVDNQFGSAYTFVSPVYNENTEIIGVVCCDVSISDFYTDLINSFKYKFAVFVILTVIFAICQYVILRKVLYKPIRKISHIMSEFLKNGKRDIPLQKTTTTEFENIRKAFGEMQHNADEHIKKIESLTKEKAEIQAEITVAGEVQRSILPTGFYSDNGIEIEAMLKSAVNVSGDFYDYCKYGDGNIMVAIGDVSGKGVSASMFMARVFLLLRVFLYITKDVATALKLVNNELTSDNANRLFVTLFLASYDRKTKTLTYSNAGHNIPYLLSDKVIPLDSAKGLLIGMFENEEYENATVRLKEDDTLFLYTDGVNEAQNSNSVFYGIERLEKLLEDTKDNIISTVYSDIKDFMGDAVQYDDITMLTLSVKDSMVSVEAKRENFSVLRIKCAQTVGEENSRKEKFFELLTVLEEAFVNICNYSYPDKTGEVSFSVSYLGDKFICSLRDSGIEFNPLAFESEKHSQNSTDRFLVGGQGIHLMKTMSDNIEYKYENGCNNLIISKIIK